MEPLVSDMLRVVNIILTLMNRIFTMQEELNTLKAVVADQSAKIDQLAAKPQKPDPADVIAVAEIRASLDANTAKLDAAIAQG